jgi:hypothetical protein
LQIESSFIQVGPRGVGPPTRSHAPRDECAWFDDSAFAGFVVVARACCRCTGRSWLDELITQRYGIEDGRGRSTIFRKAGTRGA